MWEISPGSLNDAATALRYRLIVTKVDLDELIDSNEVAALLGVASRQVVIVYTQRYKNFPKPVLNRARFKLWLRSDIERWNRARDRPV
jgi:glutathione-regulated potassium-efflux system ancillary protein KefG